MATGTTAKTLRAGMVAAAIMAGLGQAACAKADPVDLQVVDRESGQVLPVWARHGRLYVAGDPGGRYSLRVTNNTGGRVKVVMSVDGVNVVSGQTASWRQTGYVIYPGQTYDVTGWRKSDDEVAAFTFAPLSESYAARTGRPAEVGVIGIAVFQERAAVAPTPPAISTDRLRTPPIMYKPESVRPPISAPFMAGAARSAAPPPPPPPAPAMAQAGRADAEQSDERLGTGHGERERSVVTMVSFEAATAYPMFTRQIEYDTYAHLVAEGVIRRPLAEVRHPRPFPTAPDAGFVPDPPDDP
jgi:hypothetical protein